MEPYHQSPQSAKAYAQAVNPRLHEGVRTFMNGVYGFMAAGIGLTALVAYGMSQSMDAMMMVWGSPLRYLVMFGPFIFALVLQARMHRMDRHVALGLFGVFAALMGAALSYVPVIFSGTSIVGVLLATVGMFAGMAAFGWVTKKDLTAMGQFFVMALFGIIIASFLNIFLLHSTGLSMWMSAGVAIISAGLTAYHTQAIKQIYLTSGARGNLAILGALVLYINFLNLFLSLLRLFGGSRD